MREAYTVKFSADLAEFLQSRARLENLSVADFLETLVARERQRVEESEQLTIQADPDLLAEPIHVLIRDFDETDGEYKARSDLFGALLVHARAG
jgi:hypothetical protein